MKESLTKTQVQKTFSAAYHVLGVTVIEFQNYVIYLK